MFMISTAVRFCQLLLLQTTADKNNPPRPESGSFAPGYASPSCEAGPPQNHRTHSAPDLSLSLSLKTTTFR